MATLRELELRRRQGELIEVAAIEREWSSVLRQCVGACAPSPAESAPQLPHLTAHDGDIDYTAKRKWMMSPSWTT